MCGADRTAFIELPVSPVSFVSGEKNRNILIQQMVRKRIRMRPLSVESLLRHLHLPRIISALRFLLRFAVLLPLLALIGREHHDGVAVV
jgi:hypothetical protein